MNYDDFEINDKKDKNKTAKKDGSFKLSQFFKANGLYIMLVSCLIIVGVAAAFLFTEEDGGNGDPTPMLSPSPQDVSSDLSQRLDDIIMPTPFGTGAIPHSPTGSPQHTPSVTPNGTHSPSTLAPITPKLSAPCDGEIIWGFAADELIYSETLNHWTTHHGVDIAAPVGTEVKAIDAGEVAEVYTDDEFGVTVVISHQNGHTTVYSNLKIETPVQVGDKVDAGEVIGQVGETAVAECGMQSHLHFEYYVNGEVTDPRLYVIF
ncbi:MAG: M23 family metallopeptidase [Clostridia bacterium]|nr:M23 family metallopeptidase [Clostridia bacterium]